MRNAYELLTPPDHDGDMIVCAAAVEKGLLEELKGTDRPLVVIGDLNDAQLSNTLNIMTGQPRYLVSGLNKGGGTDTGLYTVAALEEYRSLRDLGLQRHGNRQRPPQPRRPQEDRHRRPRHCQSQF
ncbi:hypothetical protein RQM65_07775 [Pricia sp. S334]|uniref:Uncharacterized protein n=1 Tax=Pricia mediterranea TaxID=3076079 RepID=A0ABU3L4R5_9FLAO|nr:hypothetical protein [Pricia sp. S334]MDT7828558.1 hypothetical protein [Pricia sp. S334]